MPGSIAIGPNGHMYNVSADGHINLLKDNGATGSKIVDITGDNPVTLPPLVSGDYLFISGSDEDFVQFGVTDYSFFWSSPGTGTPASEGSEDSNGNFIAPFGNTLWSMNSELNTNWFVVPSSDPLDTVWGPAINAANTVYAPSNNGSTDGLYAYDNSGNPLWNFQSLFPVTAPSVVLGSDGTIYFASDQLYCLTDNGSSYTQNWTYPISPNTNMAMGADGTLYMPDSVNGGFAAIGGPVMSFAVGSNYVLGGNSVSTTARFAETVANQDIANGVSLQSNSIDVQYTSAGNISGNTWNFAFATSAVVAPEMVTITLQYGSISRNVTFSLEPPDTVWGVSLSASPILGGQATYFTVNLNYPATAGGDTVTLTNFSADANIPSTVIVPEGSTSATVHVHTLPVSFQENVYLSASYNDTESTATLVLNPGQLTGIKVLPTSLQGGASGALAVYLNIPAGPGGLVVSLSSSSGDVSVPSSVTVSQGATSANVTVTTVAVSTSESVTLSAVLGSTTLTTTLMVKPPVLTGLITAPNSVMGGFPTSMAIYLNERAGTGGLTVNLSSSSADATVPTSITIPAGAGSANVMVHTMAVNTQEQVTLSATVGSTTLHATLTLKPAALTGIKLLPSSVQGGRRVALAVYLNGPAGPNGVVVNLSGGGSYATPPSTITIPAGASSANVSFTSSRVDSAQQVTLTAGLSSATVSAPLTIHP